MAKFFVTIDTMAVVSQTIECNCKTAAKAKEMAKRKAQCSIHDWETVLPFRPADSDMIVSDCTEVDDK
jgi:hypothetical protein